MSLVTDIMGVVKEKTCIVGMGNYLRKDDAVGLYLVDELQGKVTFRPGAALECGRYY